MRAGRHIVSFAGLTRLSAVACLTLMATVAEANSLPQRIVSMSLCSDQYVLSLVDPSRVAGITLSGSLPEYSNVADQAGGIPIHRGSAEEIIALKPDLVVTGGYVPLETLDMLRRLDVPTLDLAAERLSDIPADIRRAAVRLGVPEEGERLVVAFEAELQSATRSPGSKQVAALYRPGGDMPGNGTTPNDVLAAAGVANLASMLGFTGYGRLSVEELVVHQPDLLIFDSRHAGRHSQSIGLLDHPALRAVAAGHRMAIFDMPIRLWLCGSPYSSRAVPLLRSKLDAARTGASR